jgi:hypothetical protein
MQVGLTGKHHGTALLALVAATPVTFALSTWDYGPSVFTTTGTIRHMSLPVMLTELIVVGCTVLAGFKPAALLNQQAVWFKVALALLVAIMAGTTAFVAIDPVSAGIRNYFWLLHLCFGGSVAWLVSTRSWLDSRLVWWSVTAGLLGFALIVFLYVANVPDPKAFNWVYFKLGVTNVRQLGDYAAIGYCAAFALAVTATNRNAAYLAIAGATVMAGLAIWSGTRAAIVAIIGAIAVACLIAVLLRTKRTAILLIVSLVGGAVLSMVHVPPNSAFGIVRIFQESDRTTIERISSGRVDMWKAALHDIGLHPVFGYGESLVGRYATDAQKKSVHPHNSVLQALLQWGIAGALCFFGLLGALWCRLLAAVRAAPATHLPSLLVVLSVFIQSLLEGGLFRPYPVMMIALAFGLAARARRAVGGDDAESVYTHAA